MRQICLLKSIIFSVHQSLKTYSTQEEKAPGKTAHDRSKSKSLLFERKVKTDKKDSCECFHKFMVV